MVLTTYTFSPESERRVVALSECFYPVEETALFDGWKHCGTRE